MKNAKRVVMRTHTYNSTLVNSSYSDLAETGIMEKTGACIFSSEITKI